MDQIGEPVMYKIGLALAAASLSVGSGASAQIEPRDVEPLETSAADKPALTHMKPLTRKAGEGQKEFLPAWLSFFLPR